jgi:3-hydroxybutyryl-CoA dehydrogenase
MKIGTVGVIGAGNIGIGVITDLVLHGMNAVAVDISPGQLAKAQAEVLKNIRFAPLLLKGAPRLTKDEALKRMTFTEDFNQLSGCDFIIENVTENWELKKTIYEKLEGVARPEVCFAVNTSCISITRIGGITKRAAQVVGMHFMNPVHLMSTVEVIRGHHTSENTLAVVNQLLGRLKKEAIVVGDLPGFVSNRISHLFMNEAAFVFQDGLATAAQIDAIFKKCFGHKMGPLETADLIGLDTVMRSLDVLYDSFHDSKYRCCPLLRKMVDAGECGRKSGRGFYTYANPES